MLATARVMPLLSLQRVEGATVAVYRVQQSVAEVVVTEGHSAAWCRVRIEGCAIGSGGRRGQNSRRLLTLAIQRAAELAGIRLDSEAACA